MFGDRDIKRLDKKLDFAWLAFKVAAGMGPVITPAGKSMTPEIMLNDMANDEILPAASRLTAKGRRDEAKAHIIAAKRSEESPQASMWNDFLDQLVRHV